MERVSRSRSGSTFRSGPTCSATRRYPGSRRARTTLIRPPSGAVLSADWPMGRHRYYRQMQVESQKRPGSIVELSIEVPTEEAERAIDRAYARLASRVK